MKPETTLYLQYTKISVKIQTRGFFMTIFLLFLLNCLSCAATETPEYLAKQAWANRVSKVLNGQNHNIHIFTYPEQILSNSTFEISKALANILTKKGYTFITCIHLAGDRNFVNTPPAKHLTALFLISDMTLLTQDNIEEISSEESILHNAWAHLQKYQRTHFITETHLTGDQSQNPSPLTFS